MRISTQPASDEHRLYLTLLSDYLYKSERVQAAWERYCAEHSDPETAQPVVADTHGRRQNQRDEDTLAAFGLIYYHADELVFLAEQQLVELPVTDRTPRHAWQLVQLNISTQRLYDIYHAWLGDRHQLPDDAVPGTEAHDGLLAKSYADAWPHLHQWSLHGRALIEINELAQKEPLRQVPAPAVAKPVPAAAAKPSAPRR